MQIKGVIFDVDGTLLDSMPIWMNAGERYLQSMGIEAEKNLGNILFAMSMQEGAQYIQTTYGLTKTTDQIMKDINDLVHRFYFEQAAFKRGASELLLCLREWKIPMVIATSTDREMIEGAFERLGILDWFEEIFTCSEVGAGKEQPKIYCMAAEKLKLKEEYVLVVEDGLHGLITAKKAGFITAGVFDEASREQQHLLKQEASFYGENLEMLWDKMKGKIYEEKNSINDSRK